MKYTAPDQEDGFDSTEAEPIDENKGSFKGEIKDILKIPSISSKFITASNPSESPDFKFQVLHKFTEFCREEIIPRHQQAADTIESKLEKMQCQILVQQKESQHLAKERILIAETCKKLEATRLMVQERHLILSERLKVTLQILRNQCASKTFAERKMAQDLKHYEETARNLRVKMMEVSAKVRYLNDQTNARLETARRLTKPLYLDKNRVVFIRSNLTSMQKNVQQLVNRVQSLNKQMPMLCDVQHVDSVLTASEQKRPRDPSTLNCDKI